VRKGNPQSITADRRFALLRALLSPATSRFPIHMASLFAVRSLRTAASLLMLMALCAGFALSRDQPISEKLAAAPAVSKVEPPSWWAGHSINPVRLLVRGTNLQNARVQSSNAAVRTSGLLVNPRGTYLFVSLTISPRARPGSYPLKLVTPDGATTIPFSLERPLAASTHFQGITSADVIYLIMPDRFADGNPSNNAPAGAPAAANDRKNARAYHGGAN